jgi:hypothetical protein
MQALDPGLAQPRDRSRLGRPYYRPAYTGPSLLDALKAQYGDLYEIGEADGLHFAIPLDHGGPTLWGLTPRRLAEWIRADLAASR